MNKVHVRIGIHEILMRTNRVDYPNAKMNLNGEYDCLGKLLPSDYDGIIIDAGGFIGTAAIALSNIYPNSTVFSIEPSPENFELLRENTARYSNIVPYNGALVPPSVTSAQLFNRKREDGFTLVPLPADNPGAVAIGSVNVVCLRAIKQRFPGKEIRLIKMDIEGAEKEMFTQDASELQGIDFVFVELHDRIAEGCTEAFQRFSENRSISNFGGEKYLSARK